MSNGMFRHLRALVLLAAFGSGFIAQLVAAAAMPLPMAMRQGAVVAVNSNSDSSDCATCPMNRDLPGPGAVAPGCPLIFCSALSAVVPAGPIVAKVAGQIFPQIAGRIETGVTVRPDHGPPKPLHHT
jgi:hypothetical protein